MTSILIALALTLQTVPDLHRDSYGVPHINASSWNEAFFNAGYACAEDRLWQMENSRRLAEGRLSEVFGPHFAASDKQVLQFAYTDRELMAQFDGLSAKGKAALTSYVRGVNAFIERAKKLNTLPEGYAKNGFAPETWRIEDSIAIEIRLFQLFGRGGAGELRNMALLTYLQSQPSAKDKVLDILEDFAWENDLSATTTVPPGEDPLAAHPPLKVNVTREQTERQLSQLPKLNLFELLPGLSLASRAESTRVAERLNVPYKTGSYCVVAGASRTSNKHPILLSGPQMGFRSPSIIHEMSIEAPGLKVVGMDVPGAPGVVLGMTPRLAWGLTSGVADTEDIFDFVASGASDYLYKGKPLHLEPVVFPLKVKGEATKTVLQQRTLFGPVVLHAKNHYFVRRSAYWGVEMKSYDALLGLYPARNADEVERSISGASMNFNFFYAMPSGDFGYRYLGRVPIRASGIDPRFPTPATPENDWKGFVSPDMLPHIRNPKSGLLANWNNKPAVWWPNYDTPVWGRIFRNEVLLKQVEGKSLRPLDLSEAVMNIARADETFPYFKTYLQALETPSNLANGAHAADHLKQFNGQMVQGSVGATLYRSWFNHLRTELFASTTGNFMAPEYFDQIAQPSVMWAAMQGHTRVKYLGTRSAQEVAQTAFAKAVEDLSRSRSEDMTGWGFIPGGIPVPGQQPIPYSNRGSYIQIIELLNVPVGRNVLTPGESESGGHALDQVSLARAWQYKPMRYFEAKP